MESYSALLTRRSIRRYKDTPIEMKNLNEIVRAGMYAPSPFNRQPWEFVIVTDREVLNSLSKATHLWRMLRRVPAAIVVLMKDVECMHVPDNRLYYLACSAATENILIAAHGQGFGSAWLALYPMQDRIDLVKEILNVPEGFTPFSVLPIGVPDEEFPAYDFFDETKVHYNKF